MNTTCPICRGQYYATEFSMEVCEIHENWIITVCGICHRTCFSDCRGYCTKCLGDAPAHGTLGGTRDHRAKLRGYGLEGFK